MNKVLRTVFSFAAMTAAVFTYAVISQNAKASQTAASNSEAAVEDVSFDVNNGSVNVALVDVYETIGNGEAVEKPAYRAGGSRKGKLVLNVPAGTSAFGFTAATPKGTPDQELVVSIDGQVAETFTVKATDGFTGYAPYEVAFADAEEKASYSYIVKVPENGADLTFELELTNRVMLWDVQIGKAPKTGKYLVKNLATGKFWAQANDWGTRASLVDNPEFLTFNQLEDGTYTLESNVNNGGTQYYFEGDYMDNGNPKHLIIKNELTHYTISDGNIFYGYDGSTTILGKTETNAEADNVKWQLIAESEIPAYLAQATEDAPVNATFLVLDANFGRNNRNQGAWVVSADCTNKNLSGGNNINNNAESYHSVFTISQTIEGVPNGVYGLTAQGFYRQDGQDNENLPVFFINDEQTVFPEKTGTENSMSDASVSFSAGKYTIDMMVVEVKDGKITLGTKLQENTNLWCIWDNFTLTYYGDKANLDNVKFGALIEQLNDLVAKADALNNENLPVAYKDNLAKALEGAQNPTTVEEYKAAIEALNNAIQAANSAADAQAALAAMKAEMDNTNVYTAEAWANYQAIYDEARAKMEIGEAVAVANPQAITAWHGSNGAIDDLLLSAWTINDVQCYRFNTALYINTWSVEGETDGSEFKVPFFEYWTGDDQSLGAATLTATLTDQTPNAEAEVTLWARVRLKNNTSGPTYGITLDVNGGEATDLGAGENVPNTPFYLAQFTAKGLVDADGVLKININVDADNNISWLSFKNVTFETVAPVDPVQKAYEQALATIENGGSYRIFTDVADTRYYLKADGYLTANEDDAKIFSFSAVNAAGTLYETGWNLGCRFTNAGLTNGSSGDIVNDGHIHVGGNNRDNWERQVFFLNDEGKYAVRATNANSEEWGGNTYWNVIEGAEQPEAGYTLEAAYIWQLQDAAILVVLNELKNIIARGNAFAAEQGDASIAALDAIDADALTTKAEAQEAIQQAKKAIADYIAGLNVNGSLDVTNGVLTNPNPITKDGWEGDNFGTASDGVCEYWNQSGVGFHQTATLPAGDYKLTVVALQRTGMTGYVYAGEAQTTIVNVESSVANSRAQAASWFAAGNGVNEVFFSLENQEDVEIGLKADATTGDHWTVWQSFKIEKVANADIAVAVAAYEAALAAANAQAANTDIVGDNLFQKSQAAYDALNATIDAEKLDVETASADALNAAAAALNAAVETYKSEPVNAPETGVKYTFQQKASDLYLALDAEGDHVLLSDVPVGFLWTEVEGGYNLTNEDGVVGLAGTNAWTMSAAEANALLIEGIPTTVDGELYYYLGEKNGVIASDGTEVGEYCYADKAKSFGDRALWRIAKAEDGVNAVAVDGNSQVDGIDNVNGEADEPKTIFDLSGRRVAKAVKGIFIVNGKKVVK